MRLTNALKEQLMLDIITDQFADDFRELDAEFKETFKQEVVGIYGDMDAELVAMAEKYKVNRALMANPEHSVSFINENDNRGAGMLRRYAFVKQAKYTETNGVFAFSRSIYPGIYVPPTNAWGERFFKPEQVPKTAGVVERQSKLMEETSPVINDLCDVLKAVTTDKALKALTNVFTPFLPAQDGAKALVPAEAILRVNELKTPKKAKKRG